MKFKDKVRQGKLTLGTWLTIPHITVVEVLAQAKIDWICIDIEHTAIDFESTLHMISFIQSRGKKALVRVGKNDEVILKRVLDAGVDGVIVPMVNSKQDVENLVNHIYYPPIGKRGVGLNRAQDYGYGFEEYQRKLKEDIVVVAQIEHKDAIANLDDIISNEYIDATLIGPYDLSASFGLPGQFDKEIVQDALKTYEAKCTQAGKTKGAHVIQSDASFTQAKIDQGYSFLSYSIDFLLLGDTIKANVDKLLS